MTSRLEVSAVTKGAIVTVTLNNGATFTMPAKLYEDAKKRAQLRPSDWPQGDCGYSYTYLFDWGNLTYRLAVGFHVDQPAIGYTWSAYVNGAGNTPYEYEYGSQGDLAFRSNWAGEHTGTVPAADYYDADTVSGAAELFYGVWCFAGYTSDSTYVN